MKYSLQERIRSFFKYLPIYRKEYKEEMQSFQDKTLENVILKAIKNVKYYRKYTSYIRSQFKLSDFPILRKSDILGHEEDFVSKKYCKRFMTRVETGGSTGMSLSLYYSISTLIKKNVITDHAFSIIGKNMNIAVLRGNKPVNGQICEVVGSKRILLSSYLLNESNLDTYITILNTYNIECLHVYPSSITILARLIKKKYGKVNLPSLKGIFASSEIFSKDDKAIVREVFPNVKIVDFYSHNELACSAIAVNDSPYEFNQNYGYVEFVETGERINGNHRIAEIVATSIMNESMPFIRYGTEDYVELDEHNNVVSIIGRTSDFVVNNDGQIVPCIVCTRSESMQNVISFQYYQDTVGSVSFDVVVNDNFSATDEKLLKEDMLNSFHNMNCLVRVKNQLVKTKIGKQLRLIQKLDINKFN